MPRICWYFQLHQPYRLSEFEVFDLGQGKPYFDDGQNKKIFLKVADKSYRPMLKLLLKLARKHPEFHFTLSASGVFLEQAQLWAPDIIQLLQDLTATGQVEWLAETYYHSLAALYSEGEFRRQVRQHHQLIKKLFAYEPQVFRNTELIYWDHLAWLVDSLGYKGVLTEAVERYLLGRPKTALYRTDSRPSLPIFLKHAELSDDIAFRFSDKNWQWHPLTTERYLSWLREYYPDEQINLFMDFETFGEHQWVETGIFAFFEELIKQLAADPRSPMVTPTQVVSELTAAEFTKLPVYKVPEPISWADVDRDLTAWRDNELQHDSLRLLYSIEAKILQSDDPALVENWRRLQTSDHFYYMCIKWSADGDVHKYFSPYEDPFEAYRRFSAVVADLTT